MENWQAAIVLVILIITIWNFIRFGLGMKEGILNTQGVHVFLDSDVDVVVSSLGLLMAGAALGSTATYMGFAKDLMALPSKLTASKTEQQ
jgi:hypothetical protein